jgi:hypothetical protein
VKVILETDIGPIASELSEESVKKMADDLHRYLVVRESLDFGGDGEIHIYERNFDGLFVKTKMNTRLQVIQEAQREPSKRTPAEQSVKWARWPEESK